MLLLYGVGSTIGVFIGGRLADWKLMPSLIGILATQALAFTVVYLVSPNPWIMTVAVLFWGGVNFAFGSPLQSRILAWAADAPNLASALIPSCFNIGIAIGAVLGAALLESGFGYRNLPLIGTAALVLALGIAVLSYAWERRSGISQPQLTEAAAAE
jgi:DHA1 family inner membrane transport protein